MEHSLCDARGLQYVSVDHALPFLVVFIPIDPAVHPDQDRPVRYQAYLGTDDVGPAPLADPTVALPNLQHHLRSIITFSHYSSPTANMFTIQAFH